MAVHTALAVCFHTFLLIIRAYSDSVLKYNKLVSAIMLNILTVIPDYNTLRVCVLSPALRECCKTCFQGVMSVLSLQWVGREGRVKNKQCFCFRSGHLNWNYFSHLVLHCVLRECGCESSPVKGFFPPEHLLGGICFSN